MVQRRMAGGDPVHLRFAVSVLYAVFCSFCFHLSAVPMRHGRMAVRGGNCASVSEASDCTPAMSTCGRGVVCLELALVRSTGVGLVLFSRLELAVPKNESCKRLQGRRALAHQRVDEVDLVRLCSLAS